MTIEKDYSWIKRDYFLIIYYRANLLCRIYFYCLTPYPPWKYVMGLGFALTPLVDYVVLRTSPTYIHSTLVPSKGTNILIFFLQVKFLSFFCAISVPRTVTRNNLIGFLFLISDVRYQIVFYSTIYTTNPFFSDWLLHLKTQMTTR